MGGNRPGGRQGDQHVSIVVRAVRRANTLATCREGQVE